MAQVLTNSTLATMVGGYGLIPQGAVVMDGDRIIWAGPMAQMPKVFRDASTTDCEGRLLTPGLIDAHTHLVHGGHRAEEFELRLNGASYEQVARAGGGMVTTPSRCGG